MHIDTSFLDYSKDEELENAPLLEPGWEHIQVSVSQR